MEVPNTFICPISMEIMVDPVILSDGITYERQNILNWFALGKKTSPKTNMILRNFTTTDNWALKIAI